MTDLNTIDARTWWDDAACRGLDPDLFYPELGSNGDEAKEVCRVCPVRLQCLEFSLDNHEKSGIWGGYGKRERRRLAAARRASRR